MNWSKLISALISFLGTFGLTYANVPLLAVVFLMAMVIAFTNIFIKKGDYRIDISVAVIAIIICFLTGNYYLGF